MSGAPTQRELWPRNPIGWQRRPAPPAVAQGAVSVSAWVCGPIFVISALELADAPDGTHDIIPQWNISISASGKRPKPTHVRKALRAFGMVGAECDNHHPGNAQHFWLPVDPARRVGCECKETETVITEPGGYKWTNPTDAPCRGCEIAPLTGRPCSLHAAAPVRVTP